MDSKAREATAAGKRWISDLSMSVWVVDSSVSSATFSFSAVTLMVSESAGERWRSRTTGTLPRTSRSSWTSLNPSRSARRW